MVEVGALEQRHSTKDTVMRELEELQAELQEDAALSIQSCWRGSQARRNFGTQMMDYFEQVDAVLWEHIKDEVSPRADNLRIALSPSEPASSALSEEDAALRIQSEHEGASERRL